VVSGQLQFTKDGGGPFLLNKPTTMDVVECSGAQASAGMSAPGAKRGGDQPYRRRVAGRLGRGSGRGQAWRMTSHSFSAKKLGIAAVIGAALLVATPLASAAVDCVPERGALLSAMPVRR